MSTISTTPTQTNSKVTRMNKLYIIGSGGFSKQVIEIVEEMNRIKEDFNLCGLIDDNPEKQGKLVLGYEVVGTTDYLNEISIKRDIYAVIAISSPVYRRMIAKKLQRVKWPNLVHPRAIVSKYVRMGQGNIISGGVTINPDTILENHCHINIGSTLGHDVKLESYVTIMPGVRVSGMITIEEDSTVGTGATILQGLKLARNTYVGAGAVVIRDTLEDSLYVGVPARKTK